MLQYIRLYRFHTKLIPGLYKIFCAIENGVIDVCLLKRL
ncbi:hypothetical protein AZE42_12233 [Rhizopogon vesiculosus]|uniref:Uncharacterized protein n=1 Tax=Rhizopogon vesiculosus TaxID=180088 RepID=A0A1J8QGR1_9AGAM|nr:hypothetical protein AZE42_12233 [Rhizopogon vesiculosus]